MIHKSLWEKTKKKVEIPSQKIPEKTDILIIGGGMAGISTAFYLKDSPYQVTVIDKGQVGMGVTSKTTGKLTYLQGLIYDKLRRFYSLETSKQYLHSQKDAIKLVTENVNKYEIDCHLQKVDSYVFVKDEKEVKKIQLEKQVLENMGIFFQEESSLPISYPCTQAFSVEDTYVFHPLDYLLSLAKISIESGTIIAENVIAEEIKKENDFIVKTNKGSIQARFIVVCSHYPFFIKPSYIPFKSHIEKSYVLASSHHREKNFSAILASKPSDSIRYYKDYLIYGGNSHKMSTHINYEKNHKALIQSFEKNWEENIDMIWSTHDIITEDGMPYIGKVKEEENRFFIATGFNKWGMTNGTLAGKMIADMILGNENPYTELMKPYRKYNLKRTLELMKNGLGTGKIYIQRKINRNPDFYKKNVRVYKKEGIYYGEYIDEKKIKHTVYHKCPHMGCSLLFNFKDTTWDCPCHGSRFSIDGDTIEGPSYYSIRVIKENDKK